MWTTFSPIWMYYSDIVTFDFPVLGYIQRKVNSQNDGVLRDKTGLPSLIKPHTDWQLDLKLLIFTDTYLSMGQFN